MTDNDSGYVAELKAEIRAKDEALMEAEAALVAFLNARILGLDGDPSGWRVGGSNSINAAEKPALAALAKIRSALNVME